jgi:para-nitrobenzyl esterase
MALTPASLLSGQLPVLDDVLPSQVDEAFRAGREPAIPYLTGTTDLEVPDGPGTPGTRASEVRALLLGERRADALAAYGGEAELGLRLLSDVMFGEPARHLAGEHADDAPTYRYRFAIADDAVLASAGGAPHTAELAFVFDDTARQGHPVPGADVLADGIADLWVDFATDGVPDGWPQQQTGELMTFTRDGPVVGPDPWAARMDLVQTAYGVG